MPPKTELDIFSPLNKIEHLKQEAGITVDFKFQIKQETSADNHFFWGGTHNSHASLLQMGQIMVNMKIRFAHKHPIRSVTHGSWITMEDDACWVKLQ